ncbi:MAG: bifunctional glycosyltransferase family 2 protein/CDP-glycerol:glycerophosphate glycerophosphotransferase [Lachnospiraceae bacterium]|nr:bifunctional glycosyltransferase family 2 protein/CDP-glycerol:glycerophosphate glycerophosphotransferase [Lachnospiraceae bacterium]
MKFSIITPFKRGLDHLRDNLESLKDQRLRIYLDEVDGAPGFERVDRLSDLCGADNIDGINRLIESGDLDGVEALAKIRGLDDLWPLLTFDGLGNIVTVASKSMTVQPTSEGITDKEKLIVEEKRMENEEEREEKSSDNESDEEEEIRPFVYVPYRNFELIIVKDHPSDEIAGLVDEYKDIFSIKVVELTEGTGVACARNRGMEEATGEYIMFVDSDDYLFPRALYFMDRASHTAADPDIIYGMKVWTWYSRNGFIATFNKQQQEEENNAQGDDSADDGAAEEAREREERMKSELSEQEYIEYRRTNAASRLISRRKGIRNVSALGISYKRTLLIDNNIRFPEQFRYYSDFPFLCLALEKATSFRKNYRSWYIKRKHADSINFPSLAQEKSEQRFPELLESYTYTKSILDPEGVIRKKADIKFIGYYTGYYVTRLRRSENDYWRNERFEECRKVVGDIPKSTLKCVSRYKRRLIELLKKGDLKKTYRKVSFRLALKKIAKCLTSKAMIVQSFYVHVFLKKPIRKDVILFECFFGRSYGDNPRAMYEYIQKTYPGRYICVWSMAKAHGNKIPYKHKTVRRFGLRYAYYIARSKFFIFNTKQPGWMRKREGQVFLETWHGTPLKKLAFDMEDNFSASPGYKKHIYSKTRSWDYLVAANSFSSEVFKHCFMYENKMLEYGYPRNDVLHASDRDERAAAIRKKLGIPAGKKTILYAPTWRDDEFYAAGEYKFTLQLDLELLRKKLGDDYAVILRTHYYIADKLDIRGLEGFAYNLSKYPDIADIYLISDICITDYSSVFFDYAGLKRPILFYTYDIDKYRDILRGFYFDMESTVPGPLLYTSEEVADAILDIGSVSARFKDRYDAFYERFCSWENGHACENIYDEVFVRGEKERALEAERAERERLEEEQSGPDNEDII